jgi:hypothetical protein
MGEIHPIPHPKITINAEGGALKRGVIVMRMTGDTSTFCPLVKENTSNCYTPMKNNISSVAFVGETEDDHLTCATHLKPKGEIYAKDTHQSVQHTSHDLYTHQCRKSQMVRLPLAPRSLGTSQGQHNSSTIHLLPLDPGTAQAGHHLRCKVLA